MRKLAALALVVLAACSGGGDGEGEKEPPPVTRVVEGDYRSVVVSSGGEERRLPVGDLVPLLAARSFEPVEPLREYGLDRPAARFHFPPNGPTVLVGDHTVDGAFRYVQVEGDDTIHTVPAAVIDQRLAPR